jgi:hypothetical protein
MLYNELETRQIIPVFSEYKLKVPNASMPGRIFSLSKTMRGVSMRRVLREVSMRNGGLMVKSQVSSEWLNTVMVGVEA